MQVELESSFEPSHYQSIFYDRPINSLRKKNIAILVGSNTNLFEIQQIYSIISAMNHNPVLVVDDRLREVGLPADIYLSTHNKSVYENSEEAIARISDCHGLIAGVGLEQNASMQLLLERILNGYRGFIVLTESTFRFPGILDLLSSNMLLVGSTKQLVALSASSSSKLNQNGLLRKIEILHNFANQYGVGVICTESHQVIGLEVSSDMASVVNSETWISASAFVAILFGLLADRDEPIAAGWGKYYLAAGYLYKHYYQKTKNPQGIKDFLQAQF